MNGAAVAWLALAPYIVWPLYIHNFTRLSFTNLVTRLNYGTIGTQLKRITIKKFRPRLKNIPYPSNIQKWRPSFMPLIDGIRNQPIMDAIYPLKPHLHEQFFLDKFALTRKNCSCRWGIVDKFSLSRKIWRASFSLTRKNCQVRNLLV